MKTKIQQVTDDLNSKAESYAIKYKNHTTLINQVMQIGGKAMLTRNFTLQQAEEVTAMMIAALALVKAKE